MSFLLGLGSLLAVAIALLGWILAALRDGRKAREAEARIEERLRSIRRAQRQATRIDAIEAEKEAALAKPNPTHEDLARVRARLAEIKAEGGSDE